MVERYPFQTASNTAQSKPILVEKKAFKIKRDISPQPTFDLEKLEGKPVGIPNYDGIVSLKKIGTPLLVEKMRREKEV